MARSREAQWRLSTAYDAAEAAARRLDHLPLGASAEVRAAAQAAYDEAMAAVEEADGPA